MRFFYYIPEGGKVINFTVSPGHYGRSFGSMMNTRAILYNKILSIADLIEKTKYFSPDDAGIDIGASQWDKRMIRVRFQVTILSPLNIADIEKAGFSVFPSDFSCY